MFSEDTEIEIWLDKCAVMIMKRGRPIEADDVKSPDENNIRSLKEGKS